MSTPRPKLRPVWFTLFRRAGLPDRDFESQRLLASLSGFAGAHASCTVEVDFAVGGKFFETLDIADFVRIPAISQPARGEEANPISPASAQNWKGFHAGLNVGASVGGTKTVPVSIIHQSMFFFNLPNQTEQLRLVSSGAFGGVTAGYNWQSGRFVYGLEADAQIADVGGRGNFADPRFSSPGFYNGGNVDHRLRSFATLRARLGIAAGDFLFFGSAGPAVGLSSLTARIPVRPEWHAARTSLGYALSAGMEYRFSERWAARLEAFYADFGNRPKLSGVGYSFWTTSSCGDPVAFICTRYRSFRPRSDYFALRAGINHYFGAAGSNTSVSWARNWSGFYAGVAGGQTIGVTQQTSLRDTSSILNVVPEVTRADLLHNAAFGGLVAGYNWQQNAFVYGVEADLLYLSARASRQFYDPMFTYGSSGKFISTLDWMMTARTRVGYSLGQTLFYGTGGLAVGRASLGFSETLIDFGPFGPVQTAASRHFKAGHVLGAGIEHAIDQKWSVRFEALYFNLGSQIAISPVPPPPVIIGSPLVACPGGIFGPCSPDTRRLQARRLNDGILLRAGISYRFGG